MGKGGPLRFLFWRRLQYQGSMCVSPGPSQYSLAPLPASDRILGTTVNSHRLPGSTIIRDPVAASDIQEWISSFRIAAPGLRRAGGGK